MNTQTQEDGEKFSRWIFNKYNDIILRRLPRFNSDIRKQNTFTMKMTVYCFQTLYSIQSMKINIIIENGGDQPR